MSLGQSKKIAEAAGDCWHEPLVVRMGIVQLEDQGFCKKCKLHETFVGKGLPANPDLSLPENRHILIGYVETLTKDQGFRTAFNHAISKELPDGELDCVTILCVSVERILNAACRVIEEADDES